MEEKKLYLQVGDTVECANVDDMIRASSELERMGIHTDWDPSEIVRKKYILHVTDGNYTREEA